MARHYCVMGNQPRLLAGAPFDGRSITFTCDGHVANAETHDDAHIHHWTMAMSESGELSFSAEMTAEGRVVERPAFTLKRID